MAVSREITIRQRAEDWLTVEKDGFRTPENYRIGLGLFAELLDPDAKIGTLAMLDDALAGEQAEVSYNKGYEAKPKYPPYPKREFMLRALELSPHLLASHEITKTLDDMAITHRRGAAMAGTIALKLEALKETGFNR